MDIECTCSALRMAARRLSRAYDAALAPEKLTVSQYAVLGNLAKRRAEGPPTVGTLADRLGLDRTTLAHTLRPLERDGFVAVAADASDARVRRVALTDVGRDKLGRCLPLWRAAQARFDEDYGAEAARRLRASLAAVGVPAGAAPAAEGD